MNSVQIKRRINNDNGNSRIPVCSVYTTLHSTAVIILILLFRKLFGAKLWSDGRMILWLLAVVVMIIPVYPNFLFSYMFDSYPIPPFNMRFNQIAEMNNGFLMPTGDIEAVLSVWNGSG